MTQFDFLRQAWGVELSDEAKEEISNNAESLGQSVIKGYIKDSDIRKLKLTSQLPKEITRIPASTLPAGQYLVQIQKIVDITQPAKFQEDFEGGKWRLLALDLSDGDQKFRALEYGPTKSLGVHLPPGTKALLWSTAKLPVRVQNGFLLLTQDNVEVLGGEVEKLVESWRASKEVEEKRLLWRTEGIKKTEKGEGAPPWVDFDPKKCRVQNKKELDDERTEWRKSVNFSNTTVGPTGDEDKGARFEIDSGAKDGRVQSQVSSSAFARDPNAPRPKGEKGEKGAKGADKGSKGGKGNRRDRGGDYEEEKRAPTSGANSLAAFIKPAKGSAMDQETVAALLAPDPKAPAAEAWDSGWDEGWGDGWSGGGGGSWGGGGWSSSGRGGGGKGGGGKGKGGGGKSKGGGGGKGRRW